jgi:hypothetical protein
VIMMDSGKFFFLCVYNNYKAVIVGKVQI